MSEYLIKTKGQGIFLKWFAANARIAREEAEECGHKVKSVRFVRSLK